MPRSRLDPEETAALDELLARVRLLLLIASIGWAVYGVQYLLGGRWPGVLHLGAAVVTFGLRTRATARSSRASLRFLVHAAAAASFLMVLAQALLTGQERSAALWFFVTVPLFAIYTLSSRAAIAWLGVATAGFVAVYASEYVVAIPPVVVVPAYEILVAQIALGALIIAAALAARLANERHVATIRAQSEELRIQASEVTRARDAALDAARVKSEFLAMMSHEIRTPLNAVIGMATLLADGELLEGQRESIEVIRVSAEALLAVVNDVLDLSKLEAEKLEIDAAPVDVARCVEEALDQVAGPARAKGIELGYEVANDVPPIVESDGPRLRQILVNLVGNGVKFTPSGSVTVHARARAIGERTELTFEVRDTGIGIDEARRDRLFRPFSQVDASTTREFGGTGLGLAISKKLCELLGGRIEVESAPGQGSTFRFSIMARPADRPSLVDPVLVGGRVLLVAEHARTARLLQRHATQAGCEAIVAASREDALAVLRSDQAIGCALVDLAGDEADEARFLDAIRAARPGLAVVVHARAAHPVGPNATVLAKPLKASRLREELAAALGQPAPPRRSRATPRTPIPPAAGARRVLVVDDNATNRTVALAMLARLGCQARAVEGAARAIEVLRAEPFDVVLMDVQMPEMDGYEATRRIRSDAAITPKPRVVAMTASALSGDREKCLAAGMADYVSKPVRPEALARVLGRTPGVALPPPTTSVSISDVLDATTLEGLRMLEATSGTSLLAELVAMFREETPRRLARLRDAVSAGDADTLRTVAHALRGSAGALGAMRVFVTATQLEASAEGGVVDGSGPILEALEKDAARAIAALDRVAQHAASKA